MQITEEELAQAFGILERERARLDLSRWQRWLSRVLFGLMGLFVVTIVSFVGMSQVSALEEHRSLLSLLLRSSLASLVLAFSLSIFTLPALWKTIRHLALVRRLGLSQMMNARWRKLGQSWMVVLPSAALIAVGVLAITTIAIGFGDDVTLLIAAAAIGLLFLVIFVAHAQSRLVMLGEVARLEKVLETHREAHEEHENRSLVEIPESTVVEIAAIEREHIREARIEAISDARASDDQYAVLRSERAAETLGQLEAEARLAVEETIDELAVSTAPEGAAASQDAISALDVPGTNLRLRFSIDSDKRQVRIHTLEAGGAEDESSP